ncbi:MAG TPA: hypothetical protein VGK19_03840 [Capsulimonadaceae bacterium]|jgi:hypothetical protein
MEADAEAKAREERRLKRYKLSFTDNDETENTSYALYVKSELRRKLSYEGIPATQRDVDEIPVDHRRLSFFTSMPAPDDILIDIDIPIAGAYRTVHAFPDEVDLIDAGHPPTVRCFSLNGVVVPWYDLLEYNPYIHYFTAEREKWTWLGSNLVACWQPLTWLPENIDRYYEAEADMTVVAHAGAHATTYGHGARPWYALNIGDSVAKPPVRRQAVRRTPARRKLGKL